MMEKVLNFFKNKSIGYYLACGAAFLMLVLTIIFYATVGTSMPNSAGSKGPATIGIFLIGALIVEIGFLVVPAFGVVQMAAMILLGCSFYKELFCCPQVLAAIVTGVAYEGGSLPAHLTYLILFFIIFGLMIASMFIGSFKKEEDSVEDMKFKKEGKINLPVLVRTSAVCVVMVAAVLVSTLTSKSIMSKLLNAETNEEENNGDEEKADPITEEIKAAAAAFDYSFDPASVHFEKEDLTKDDGTFDFGSTSGVSSLPTNGNRSDKNLVYKFEGSYAEGWQGDYSKTYAYLYLWEDGKFAGSSGSTQFRGYWYDTVNDEGEVTDLVMVTSNDASGQIIAYKTTGFYSWIVDLDSSVNGGRRIKANGYLYYPEVALFIDTGETDLSKIKVGSVIDTSGWTAQRVLKNLKYSSCYENNSSKVAWKVNDSNISNSTINVTEAGTYVVSAKWGDLEATISFTVND